MKSKPRDPNLDHLTSATYEHVYEPAEDSYLLMDAMYEDLFTNGTRERLQTAWPNCLEVGTSHSRTSKQRCNSLDMERH